MTRTITLQPEGGGPAATLDVDDLIQHPLHERLRTLRSVTGRSQTGVADAVGVSRVTVGDWENPDGSRPTSKNAWALAQLYGVPIEVIAVPDPQEETV